MKKPENNLNNVDAEIQNSADEIEDAEDKGAQKNKGGSVSLKKNLIIVSIVIAAAITLLVLFTGKKEVVIKGSDNVYTEKKVQEVVSEVIKKNEETIKAIGDLSSKIEKMQKTDDGSKTEPSLLENFSKQFWGDAKKQAQQTGQAPIAPNLQGGDLQFPAPVAPKRPALKKQELSLNPEQGGSVLPVSTTASSNPLSQIPTSAAPKRTAFLPAGTLVEGVMVTGALAPVKGTTSEFKSPTVLIRLVRNGVTANLKTFPLKNAFILAKADGIWNLERVTMETIKLVVVTDNGKVVETKITGQVQSGDDGVDGVPGKVVNPGETERMLKFLGGSTMSGIFAAMSQAQQQESTTAFGTTKTIKDQLVYELASGISKTWDNFSAWYLEQAKQAKPFVAVYPGKKVFILIQDGVAINV